MPFESETAFGLFLKKVFEVMMLISITTGIYVLIILSVK